MITINELFSGIGSQKKAFVMLEIPHKINCTVEIDKDAMLSYAAIHFDFDAEFKRFDFPNETEMKREMMNNRIGYDYKQEKHTLTRVKGIKLKKYYLAYILSNNMGDISKIEKLPYADFWAYSFPCQDLSVAGNQAGIKEGTRSGLLLEVERLLEISKEHNELPKYLMLENVKNLVGKHFKADFQRWLLSLEEIGYKNYWEILNAKDYGIPQNRERVFAISIRNDIDQSYYFPQKFDNGLRLRDMLEDNVDEKYYLSETMLKGFTLHNQKHNNKGTGFIWQPRDLEGNASCLRANAALSATDNTIEVLDNKCEVLGNLCGGKWDKMHDIAKRVHSPIGISPTIYTMGGGNQEPKILQTPRGFNKGNLYDDCPTITSNSWECNNFAVELPAIVSSRGRNPDNPNDRTAGTYLEQRLEVNTQGTSNALTSVQKDNYVIVPEATKQGYSVAVEGDSINLALPNPKTRRGRVGKGVANTLDTSCNQGILSDFRIRKLTPKECWRLMGFTDLDFEKAKHQGVFDSQLYKQAGNSIVTNVLYYLYKNLFVSKNIPKDYDVQIKFF